jgi:hypothetical protein
LSGQNAEFGFGQIEPTAVPKRGIATKEPWACNAVRSARPAVSPSAAGRLAVDIEIVLDQHDGFGAREMDLGQIPQNLRVIRLRYRCLRLKTASNPSSMPAHAVEHGGAGVQGIPDLLSLRPAPATTSAVLFACNYRRCHARGRPDPADTNAEHQ